MAKKKNMEPMSPGGSPEETVISLDTEEYIAQVKACVTLSELPGSKRADAWKHFRSGCLTKASENTLDGLFGGNKDDSVIGIHTGRPVRVWRDEWPS